MKTDDLIRVLAADTTNNRGLLDKRFLAVTALALAAVAVIYLTNYHIRYDLFAKGFTPTVMKLTFALALSLGGGLAIWRLARPDAWQSKGLQWIAIPVAVLGVFVSFDLASRGFETALIRGRGINPMTCFVSIATMSVVPLIGLLFALKRAAPAHPGRVGAFTGVLSAGLGASIYALYCVNDSPLFLVWYVLATVVAATAGAILGSSMLRW